jgi:flagellar biosynthesis/type III secretory pathway M-ring protein FliF/YscJ
MVLRLLIAAAVAVGCDATTVLRGADPAQVAETDRALRAARVPARVEGGDVVVPRAEVPRAVAALSNACGEATDSLAAQGDRPLLATEPEVRGRREAALSRTVASMLRELPGVQRARVRVALPPPQAFDAVAAERPRASVTLAVRADAADDARVRALVAAAVADLHPDDVLVTRVPAPTDPPFAAAWVGPFAVHPASAGALRGTLAGLLGLVAALAAAVVALGLRGARRGRA